MDKEKGSGADIRASWSTVNLRFGIGIVGGLALIAALIIATQISAGALFLTSIALFTVGSALFIKFGRKSGPDPLVSTEVREFIACHSTEKKKRRTGHQRRY